MILNIETMPVDVPMLQGGQGLQYPSAQEGLDRQWSFISVYKMNAFAEGEAKQLLLPPAWQTGG